MTRQRNDSHSTEFGMWLREQPSIDSQLGYVATNIDYMWTNYKTGDWMLIEEKRYGSDVSFCQRDLMQRLHNVCLPDKQYKGIHLIVFENTSPADGKIWLDRQEITPEQLVAFLRFEHV